MTYSTDILLATFNGARYLDAQLKSLDQQTCQDWRILVRDDGSTDATRDIIRKWGTRLGDRFHLVDDISANLGPVGNFSALCDRSTADYFLFCDQDDVWMPDKIERLKSRIQALENIKGQSTPLIVHSDLILVDENLNKISESFWTFQQIRDLPTDTPWISASIRNVVTGCAMIGNRALLDRALPIPDEAMMHDWWLCLVTALFGTIEAEARPTVNYRQHTANTLGAKKWSIGKLAREFAQQPISTYSGIVSQIAQAQRQSDVAHSRFAQSLSPAQAEYLLEFSRLQEAGFLHRKHFVFKHPLFAGEIAKRIGLACLI